MWLQGRKCCQCDCSDRFSKQTINLVYAGVSGALFAIGWWSFIDAACVHPEEFSEHAWFVVPGIGATVAFVVVNSSKIPNTQMNPIYMSRTAIWCLRFVLFIGFFLSFSMIFVSALMFSLQWGIINPQPPAPWSYAFAIPQTICITIATFLYYFGVDKSSTF